MTSLSKFTGTISTEELPQKNFHRRTVKFKQMLLAAFMLSLGFILTDQETKAQGLCPDSYWNYEYLTSPDPPYNSVSWLQNGTAAINRWSFQGHLSPGPILTIANTEPVGVTHPNYEISPASIRLMTNTWEDVEGSWMPDYKFGESFIEFTSQSPNVTWDVGTIKTVDNLGGDYDANNLTRNVSAGLAFYDANGPTFQQTVSGGRREVFRIINGNMGVGATDPLHKFVVQADPDWDNTMVTIDHDDHDPFIQLNRATGDPTQCPDGGTVAYPWRIELDDDWQQTGEYGSLMFKTSDVHVCPYESYPMQTVATFTRDGRLLLGDLKYTGSALTEDLKLSVDGGVVAKEMVVTLNDWADHVFEDDYNLMSLSDLESSIKSNGHLPGMPSEADVIKNGVSVGEMQKKMMQKIEELTLYVIELKKENERIKAQLNNNK